MQKKTLELLKAIVTLGGRSVASEKLADLLWPETEAYFQHLVANGKKPLQAVCAIMRKLLHAIHGMLKHNEPFDNTRFYAIPTSVG